MRKIKFFMIILALCIVSFAIGRLTLLPVDAASNPNAAPQQAPSAPTTVSDEATLDASDHLSTSSPKATVSISSKATSLQSPTANNPTPEEPPKLSLHEENELIAAEYPDLPLDALGEKHSYEYKIYQFYKTNSTFICFTNEGLIVQYRDKELLQTWNDLSFYYGDELIDISCLGEDEPTICIINEHETHARHQLIELRNDGTVGLLYNLVWVEREPGIYNDLHGLALENGTLYRFSRKASVIETEKILDDVIDAGYGGPYIVVTRSDGIAYMKLTSSFYGEYDDSANRYLVLGDSEYWTPRHVASSWKSYTSPSFTNYPTTGEFTWFMKGDQAEFVEFD